MNPEMTVSHLKKWAEDIAGRWNGKEVAGEDKAMCAKEIMDKCDELELLLAEMAEY